MTEPATTHLTFRAPADLADGLDRVARILDRDRSWVLIRALRQYLDHEGREIVEDAAAIAALDRGESVPFADLLAELDELLDGSNRKKRRPAR